MILKSLEGQGSVWDYQNPGWNGLWSTIGHQDAFPDPQAPGWTSFERSNREYDRFSNHWKDRRWILLA